MKPSFSSLYRRFLVPCLLLLVAAGLRAEPIKVLLIDGQNNHEWRKTTPVLKKVLEDTGLFVVEVATSPAPKADMSGFKPDFAKYKVIVSNYNGEPWAPATEKAFVEFVRGGGGFVPVHAANNAFPGWKEYNEMIGVGGWGGRNEKSGAWLYWQDKVVRDFTPGPGGSHGTQHEFVMENRDPTHPITAGLPVKWLHGKDELYDRLRGPAQNLTVLATAYSDPATRGTGKNEPLLMVLQYGQGRVFHTALGHGLEAVKCAGFQTTFQRGVEWAATGKVTQKVPADFPTATQSSTRP